MQHDEFLIQAAIVDFFEINKVLIFSVPNGTNITSPKTRSIYSAAGLRSGVSDLIAVFPDKPVFIEVKTKTGRQSDTQKAFQAQVERLGYEYVIMRSVSDAQDFLKRRKAK